MKKKKDVSVSMKNEELKQVIADYKQLQFDHVNILVNALEESIEPFRYDKKMTEVFVPLSKEITSQIMAALNMNKTEIIELSDGRLTQNVLTKLTILPKDDDTENHALIPIISVEGYIETVRDLLETLAEDSSEEEVSEETSNETYDDHENDMVGEAIENAQEGNG